MATLVVTANIDGGLLSEATTSAGANAGTGTLTVDSANGAAHIGGQTKFGTNDFGVYEPFYSFDTSPLGASASASAVVLATAFTGAGGGITGTLRCYLNSSWDEAISTGDFRTATQLGSQTNLATLASGSVTTGDTYINWTDVAFPANVNLTGHTLVVLSTNRIVAGTAPTLDETFLLSVTNKPKITITYTITGVTGTGASTFGAMTVAGVGAETFTGTGASTFGAMTVAATGEEDFTGTGAVTFGAMTVAGVGSETISGTGASTFGAMSVAAAGVVPDVYGSGASTFGAMTVAGVGEEDFTGSGAVTFGAMTVAGAATETITGAGAVAFAAMTVGAAGVMAAIHGDAAVTFAAMTVSAAGVITAPTEPIGPEFWMWVPNISGIFQRTELMNAARKGTWRHPFEDVGHGSFVIDASDPKATNANLAVENLVACYLNGVCRYAFLVTTPTNIVASPDGPSAQLRTIEGDGMESYLSKAGVYPAGWGSSLIRPLVTTVDPVFADGLTADVTAGATNIKVLDASQYTVNGLYGIVAISDETFETFKVTAIGTSGSGGTGLTLAAALLYDHPNTRAIAQAGEWPRYLAADTAIGANVIKIDDITGIRVGTLYQIAPVAGGTSDDTEVVKVATIGTPGSAGTGLSFTNDGSGTTLRQAHHGGIDVLHRALGSVLAASASVGATSLKVTDVSDYVVGEQITVGGPFSYETRVLTSVGTAGSGGTGLGFATPLLYTHATGEFCVITTNSYSPRRTFEAAPGAILAQLIEESQIGRGELPALSATFTTGSDTNHVGWGASVVLELSAGSTLLEAWQKLTALGLESRFTFDDTSGEIVLDAFATDPTTDLTPTIVWEQGINIRDALQWQLRQDQWRSRMLVEGANGAYVEIVSPDETVTNRRDGYLSFANTDDAATLTLAGTEALAAAAADASPLNVKLFHHAAHSRPYDDFAPGDTVALTVPGTWDRASEKVVAIVVGQHDPGDNDYDVEADVGSPRYNAAVQLKRQIDALATRTVPGSSVGSNSVAGDAIADGSIGAAKINPADTYTVAGLVVTRSTVGITFAGTDYGEPDIAITYGVGDGTNGGISVGGPLIAAVQLAIPVTTTTYTTALRGNFYYDKTAGRLHIWDGSGDHYWARTAGVEVPKDAAGVDETICPQCGRPMLLGERAVVRFDHLKPDGGLHGLWEHERCPD